jgi:hypothetical protein
MDELEIIDLKKVAGQALSEMIDKMINETDFNDTVLTVSIAGHDIKGCELSLNQYSVEININKFITAGMPRFIRYPEYFGMANRELLRDATTIQKEANKAFSEKDAIERAQEHPSNVFNTLDSGIRILETTGFGSETIGRVIETIENGEDPYNPREIQNLPPTIEEQLQQLGYTREQLSRNFYDMPEPVNNRQRCQLMIRQMQENFFLDGIIRHIDEAQREQLLAMSNFDDLPRELMIDVITRMNNYIELNMENE